MLIFYVIEGGRVVDPATKMHFNATLSQQQSESPHKKWILMPHCPKNKSESPHKNGMEQMQRHMSSFWAKYTV